MWSETDSISSLLSLREESLITNRRHSLPNSSFLYESALWLISYLSDGPLTTSLYYTFFGDLLTTKGLSCYCSCIVTSVLKNVPLFLIGDSSTIFLILFYNEAISRLSPFCGTIGGRSLYELRLVRYLESPCCYNRGILYGLGKLILEQWRCNSNGALWSLFSLFLCGDCSFR